MVGSIIHLIACFFVLNPAPVLQGLYEDPRGVCTHGPAASACVRSAAASGHQAFVGDLRGTGVGNGRSEIAVMAAWIATPCGGINAVGAVADHLDRRSWTSDPRRSAPMLSTLLRAGADQSADGDRACTKGATEQPPSRPPPAPRPKPEFRPALAAVDGCHAAIRA